MVQDVTAFVINGSSLGGGELDAIIRASLVGGVILPLQAPAPEVREAAEEAGVPLIEREWAKAFHGARQGTLVLNGFLRDLTIVPHVVSWKLRLRSRLSVVLAVHSDPSSGVVTPPIRTRLALGVYKLFGLLLAQRVRFVSQRQLETFGVLARHLPFYIDPPTSPITRRLAVESIPFQDGARSTDFLFVGRLSHSMFLGDPKNMEFLIGFADLVEQRGSTFKIIASGKATQVAEVLAGRTRTEVRQWTADLSHGLRNSKVVIIPSIHEGYCLLAREAALHGCRVLVSRAVAPEVQALSNVEVMESLAPTEWFSAGVDRE